MVLSDADALNLLTSPLNNPARAEALLWQDRVRFHGLTVRDKRASAWWPHYLRRVAKFLLADDKLLFFENIFPFPTPTTRLTAEVQDALVKVFDAVNPSLTIDGADGVEDELLAHLDAQKEPEFWRSKALPALFESHNDLLLVDIRQNLTTGQAEPYVCLLPLESVISIDLNEDSTASTLAYKTADGSFVVVDEISYRVYRHGDSGEAEYLPTETFVHNLGVCPARLLCDELVPNHPVAAASLLDEVLSELDTYNDFYVFYLMFKMFGAFPVTYSAESQDQTPKPAPAIYANRDGTPDAGFDGACRPQPGGGNSFVAPGEHYTVPVAYTLDGKPLQAPFGMVEPSTNTLTFHSEDIERMYDRLVTYLTGKGGESAMMDTAINEKQVTGNFSSKENTLRYLSGILSRAREWSISIQARLKFANRVKSVTFTFGSEFYLQTETELWDGLTVAKEAGSPQTILLEKIQLIQSFRLRSGGNPTRSQILLDLEPYPEQSTVDLQLLAMTGTVDQKDYAVKVQFTNLIRSLERAFGADITQIGSGLTYPDRINRISQFLYANVKVTTPVIPPPVTPDKKPVNQPVA